MNGVVLTAAADAGAKEEKKKKNRTEKTVHVFTDDPSDYSHLRPFHTSHHRSADVDNNRRNTHRVVTLENPG